VVCGGDGTQSAVVPYFRKSKSTLGVVPAGTGNSFALGLGIEGTFEAAADAIAHGQERLVDLGCVNGTYFANFVTIGLAAQIGEETPRILKAVLGPVAYGLAGIEPMLTHKPFRAELRWKGHRLQVHTHQIIVANGRFYGHQPLAPDATLDDGRLTVFVRDTKGRIDVMRTYLALLRGEQANLSGVHLFSTDSKLKISTKPKAPVAVDGDDFGKTPLRLHVAPRALRVMAPAVTALSA
jgi:YegS/Rv2252/BmrU family lipid kinase